MKKNLISLLFASLALFGCSVSEIDKPDNGTDNGADTGLVPMVFTTNLERDSTTKVDYSYYSNTLKLSWANNAKETLAVYRKNSAGVYYAGTIVSEETTGTTRTFKGQVSAKGAGDEYIIMYPALEGETIGELAKGVISWTDQNVNLTNMRTVVPLVWRENAEKNGYVFDIEAYVLKLQLDFKENPGNITSVRIETMKRGVPDRVFPKAFKTADLAGKVNSKLQNKTEGTSVGEGFAESVSVTIDGQSSTETRKIAYAVIGSVENLNVYWSKYRVVVETENGTKYYSEYRSFPGQEKADANTLDMLKNGKTYKVERKMSSVIPFTSINSQYSVSSILGMWNGFGKSYDLEDKMSMGLPQIALTGMGFADNNVATSTLESKFLLDKSSQGTPNLMGKLFTRNNQDNKEITITKPTEIFLTFISEYAWSQNLLGYYHYGQSADLTSFPRVLEKIILFPNMSKPGHVPFNANGEAGGYWINPNNQQNQGQNIGNVEDAPIQEFTTVQLVYKDENGYYSNIFPAGTKLGFWVMADSKASNISYDENGVVVDNGYTPRPGDNTIINWTAPRLFTNRSWNSLSNTIQSFASGDIAKGNVRVPGVSIWGCKDNAANYSEFAYAAMMFLVSTSDGEAMTTGNTHAFNIEATSSSNLVTLIQQ